MKAFHAGSIAVGLALLAALVWEVGPGALWRDVSALGWGIAPLVLIEGVANIFHTLGWRRCLSESHGRIGLSRLFAMWLAGFSINHITPTATLGGEVTKGALLTSEGGPGGAVAGVVIDKLAYTVAQLALVSFGSIIVFWDVPLPPGVWPALFVGSAILGGGVLAFFAAQAFGKLGAVARWLAGRRVGGKAVGRLASHLSEVDRELMAFYRSRPRDLPVAVFWHMTGMAVGIAQAWYFLHLLTGSPRWGAAAGIWFLGGWFDLLTFAVPLGIGIQEGARVLAFAALGLGPALGLAFGLVLRLEQFFWSGTGLLTYGALLWEGRRRRGAAPERAAGSPGP